MLAQGGGGGLKTCEEAGVAVENPQVSMRETAIPFYVNYYQSRGWDSSRMHWNVLSVLSLFILTL